MKYRIQQRIKAVITTSTIRDTFLFTSVGGAASAVTLFPGLPLLFSVKIVAEYRAIITPKGVAYMPIKLNLWYTTDTPDQSIVSNDSSQYVFPQLTAVVLATSIGTLIIDEMNHVKAMR